MAAEAENNPGLKSFLEAALDAYRTFAKDKRSAGSIERIFSAALSSADRSAASGLRLPVCDSYLDPILKGDYRNIKLNRLMACFGAVESQIRWKPRSMSNPTASANFPDGHANGMVVGPGGIVEHGSIMIGASLLAPDVRYPDHDHGPEETYLVMTDGECRQNGGDWFAPGVGGSFYNTPGIKHAMRSGGSPLFAFWALHA